MQFTLNKNYPVKNKHTFDLKKNYSAIACRKSVKTSDWSKFYTQDDADTMFTVFEKPLFFLFSMELFQYMLRSKKCSKETKNRSFHKLNSMH